MIPGKVSIWEMENGKKKMDINVSLEKLDLFT
jgi:hypothetical protein